MTSKTQDWKKNKGLCITPFCRNQAAPVGNYCYKCTKRKYAAKNPGKYCFNNIKQNAKRRGHSFLLTFEQFEKFCNETMYLDKKGRTRRKLSIDRIDVSKGYSIDNIQILTVSANSKKKTKVDYPF